MQNHLSRPWFQSKGCQKVPPESTDGKILWGHPDGYFLSAQGRKLTHTFSPISRTPGRLCHNGKRGLLYPFMRHFGNKACHIIMALAFYGERPTYTSVSGKTYVSICHHLISDPLDYKPANLLCWLTREQHTEADRRQRALRKVLPDMHALSYDDHRRLQDPRVTSREAFDVELQTIKETLK